MRLARASGTMVLAILAVIVASPVAADDSTWDPSGWYVGVNVGRSKAKIDDARITSSLLGGGFTTTSISNDDSATGYKLFGGYQFNENFALEGGYFNLGKFGFTANTVPLGTLHGETRLRGLNFDAVGILPFTQKFTGFARLGMVYGDARDTFAGTGLVTALNSSPSKRSLNYKFGFGLQYDFTRNIGMRAEVERYRLDDAIGNKGGVNLFSLGLIIRFGGGSSDNQSVAAAPEPVAAPVYVVVPVVAPTHKYCSILDIQFEINQEDIQRQMKEKLGVVGTFMTKYPDTTAVIEGHSDNVGGAMDNMKLSQARAQSVVTYLEDSYHISSSRLTAAGYGESRPIADNSTGEGKRRNRRIDAVIACAMDIPGLKVAPAKVTMAMPIEFDQNKADVKPQYHDYLLKVANFLKANPAVTSVTVQGNTDNVQTDRVQAVQLSQRRAQNVVNYLVEDFGVSRSRFSAEGFGGTRRIAYNTSAEGRQANRRVNIIFNYKQ